MVAVTGLMLFPERIYINMIKIRKPEVTDINALLDIDLKSVDNSWTLDQWRGMCVNHDTYVSLATYLNDPIGFIICNTTGRILKIAVKPAFRNKGIGTKLIETVKYWAVENNILGLGIAVPESLCYNSDICRWLNNQGFLASGILKDEVKYCGIIEDGFLFLLVLRKDKQ
jgi:GNAT superfamily N-acetyltransferase